MPGVPCQHDFSRRGRSGHTVQVCAWIHGSAGRGGLHGMPCRAVQGCRRGCGVYKLRSREVLYLDRGNKLIGLHNLSRAQQLSCARRLH